MIKYRISKRYVRKVEFQEKGAWDEDRDSSSVSSGKKEKNTGFLFSLTKY